MSWDPLENIQASYFGAPEFYEAHTQALPAAQRGEAAPSLYAPIARLAIDPSLLDEALSELAATDPIDLVTASRFDEISSLADDTPMPAFLEKFLHVCGQQLQSVVEQDLRNHARSPEFAIKGASIIAGPYKWHRGNRWHRDDSEAVTDPQQATGTVYLLTVHGPPTEFARGSYRTQDFDGDFFRNPAMIAEIESYSPGTITVHDEGLALHQAPPVEHTGEPRIFMNLRASNVFSNSGLGIYSS